MLTISCLIIQIPDFRGEYKAIKKSYVNIDTSIMKCYDTKRKSNHKGGRDGDIPYGRYQSWRPKSC